MLTAVSAIHDAPSSVPANTADPEAEAAGSPQVIAAKQAVKVV
jgi:hypothetical protein